MHFGHSNIYKFKDEFGLPQRALTQDECECLMIDRWNECISEEDDVFILGDAVMDCKPRKTEEETNRIMRKRMSVLENLNGHKTIILGNHDTKNIDFLSEHFERVCGSLEMTLAGYHCILTHIPVHPSQLKDKDGQGRFDFNIHGHLHRGRTILLSDGSQDYRYVNVNVENHLYRPINHFEMISCLSNYIKFIKNYD